MLYYCQGQGEQILPLSLACAEACTGSRAKSLSDQEADSNLLIGMDLLERLDRPCVTDQECE